MFHVFTQNPYVSPEQFGASNEWATKENVIANSSTELNMEYVKSVYKILGNQTQISLLDLGCGPGSFIEPFIEDNHLVLGLDGFYVNKKYRVGAWGRHPNNFECCNIAYPFTVCYNEYANFDINNPFMFDIITTFEFMEHLYYDQLDCVFENMNKHLKSGGIIVAGISFNQQSGHFIIKDRQWWINKFKDFGFVNSKHLENIMNNNYQKYYSTSHYFCFIK